MGIKAIPVSRATVKNFAKIFATDDILVEAIDLTEEQITRGEVGCFRLTSAEGGRVRFGLTEDKRFPPHEIICVVDFDGWSLSSAHERLYKKVVIRLEDLLETEKG